MRCNRDLIGPTVHLNQINKITSTSPISYFIDDTTSFFTHGYGKFIKAEIAEILDLIPFLSFLTLGERKLINAESPAILDLIPSLANLMKIIETARIAKAT